MADVVADRLGAQMKFLGDLLGRSPLLEETQHLGLTWCQVRVWCCGLLFARAADQPEDTDHLFAVHERHAAHLDFDALPLSGNQDSGRLRRSGRAKDLAREQLTGAKSLLGGDERRVVLPANVA